MTTGPVPERSSFCKAIWNEAARDIEPNNLKKKKDKDKFETVWFLAAILTSKNTIRKETSFILWKILIQ